MDNRNRGQPRSTTEAHTRPTRLHEQLQAVHSAGPIRVSLLRPGTGPLRPFASFHVYSASLNPTALADLGEPATPRFDGYTMYVNDVFQAVLGEDLSAAAQEAPVSATQLGPHTPSRPSSLATSPRHSLSLETPLLLPSPPLLLPSSLRSLPPSASVQPPQSPAVRATAPEPSVPAPNPPAAWLPCPPSLPEGGGVGHPLLLPSRPVALTATVGRSCERKPTSRPGFSPLASPSTSRPVTPSRPPAPPRAGGSVLRFRRRSSSLSATAAAAPSMAAAGAPPAHPAAACSPLGAGGSRRSLLEVPARCGAAAAATAAAVEQRQPLAPSVSTPSYMRSTASFNAKTSTCAAARVARVLVLAADEVH